MIWNSRQPQVREVLGAEWTLKPLDAIQQATLLDQLAKTEGSAEIVDCAYLALDMAFVSVAGIVDEAGQPVTGPTRGLDGHLDREWVLGLSVQALNALIASIADLGRLAEATRKKS